MSVSKCSTVVLSAAAVYAILLKCAADDVKTPPPAVQRAIATKHAPTDAKAACPKKVEPPWNKVIARWKAERAAEPAVEPADNSYCDVCHVNYQDEELARTHRRVGVGCETCHGISDKHSEDEDGVTPPDLMYPKEHVVPFCTSCHDKSALRKVDDHKGLFSNKTDPEDNCSHCHGKKHRLKVRTRRWDKRTGKLIWSDGVRMMEDKPKAGR
jgi:hypothetical protein